MKKCLSLLILLVLFALLLPSNPVLAATNPQIPANAVTFNGHSYYLYKEEVTWSAAQAACEKLGGHLATISNAAENNVVMKLTDRIKTKYHFKRAWIGLSDPNYRGRCKWVTGEPVKYTNWVFGSDTQYAGYAYLVAEWPPASGWGSEEIGCWDSGGEDWTMAYVCEWESAAVSVSAPKSVKADQPASNTVRLVWTAGKNARKYVIWRRDGKSSDYKKIGETKKLIFVYEDKTVKNGGTYSYKVQAVNGERSAYSSVVKAYPMAKVTALTAKHKKGGRIALSWKKVSGAAKYHIYQKGPDESKYRKVKTVSGQKAEISVSPGYGKYRFYVVPVRGSFTGMESRKVSVSVPAGRQ